MMSGADLRVWRKRNGYTQEKLMLELGLGSRQTVINWEQSDEPLARTVELSLMALEFMPERCKRVDGKRADLNEYREQRRRPTEPGTTLAKYRS
jgi:transcriptional regulator with XRE-family HTH domain